MTDWMKEGKVRHDVMRITDVAEHVAQGRWSLGLGPVRTPWTVHARAALLEAVVRGRPVGGLVVVRHDGTDGGPSHTVLDGRERLRTMAHAVEAIDPHAKRWCVDLETGAVALAGRHEEQGAALTLAGICSDTKTFMDALDRMKGRDGMDAERTGRCTEAAHELSHRMRSVQIPVTVLEGMDEAEVEAVAHGLAQSPRNAQDAASAQVLPVAASGAEQRRIAHHLQRKAAGSAGPRTAVHHETEVEVVVRGERLVNGRRTRTARVGRLGTDDVESIRDWIEAAKDVQMTTRTFDWTGEIAQALDGAQG